MSRFLSNISRKQIVVILIFILAFVLIYNLSISETLSRYSELRELKAKQTELIGVDSTIGELRAEIASLEYKLGKGNPEASMLLARHITDYCQEKGLDLTAIPPITDQDNGGIRIKYQSFSVQGNLTSLVKMVHEVEKRFEFGKVVSVTYRAYTEPRSRRRTLEAHVTVQHIITDRYEV